MQKTESKGKGKPTAPAAAAATALNEPLIHVRLLEKLRCWFSKSQYNCASN